MATWISIQFEYDVRELVLVNLQYYIRVLEIFVYRSIYIIQPTKRSFIVQIAKVEKVA